MLKLTGIAGLVLAVAVLPQASASAAILGPYAAACANGSRSAMLVHVEGLKTRAGSLRIQTYGGAPANYFDKGKWQRRVDVTVPASGPIEICMPAAGPGTYAVSVRHDANANGKTDMGDGGAMSGNPRLSLTDVVFRRKPKPDTVAIGVDGGVTRVPVVMSYVHGGSFGPLRTAGR